MPPNVADALLVTAVTRSPSLLFHQDRHARKLDLVTFLANALEHCFDVRCCQIFDAKQDSNNEADSN